MQSRYSLSAFCLFAAAGLAACSSTAGNPPIFSSQAPGGTVGSQALLTGGTPSGGDLFTTSNAPSANRILRYRRGSDGRLTFVSAFPTTGFGSGNGLNGASDTIKAGNTGTFLFTVDAGSNDIISVNVSAAALTLLDKVPSRGMTPTSLAIHDNLLYVLNAGSNQIAGFTVASTGKIAPISGAIANLSGTSADDPVDMHFGPGGSTLIVTEKLSNTIDVFTIDSAGRPHGPMTNVSEALTPFGFDVTANGHVIVSNAGGGASGKASASSYGIGANGRLTEITESARNHQTASCWLALTPDDAFAYTANTGSGNVSGYTVGSGGRLTLLNASGVAGTDGPGTAPIDMRISPDDRFAYVLDSGTHAIDVFVRQSNGLLDKIQTVTGLPAFAIGLAVR
jgi:6-phosphogluconolactonase (cycloisomerase 2 family)